MEWAKFQERERKKEEEEKEKERVAYAQIDWHDFVVVETVDFQPNEQGRSVTPGGDPGAWNHPGVSQVYISSQGAAQSSQRVFSICFISAARRLQICHTAPLKCNRANTVPDLGWASGAGTEIRPLESLQCGEGRAVGL